MFRRILISACVLAAVLSPAAAQQIGPPIPQSTLPAQPVPRTTLPPAPVDPVGENQIARPTPLTPSGNRGSARGRAAECQHQASVERVPRRQRGAYLNNCMAN